MMKIALAVLAAAAVLTAPLIIPAKAQGVKMTQVDMQTGRHLDDRDPGYYRERPSGVRLQRHCWRRSRWCHHRPTTPLPHGDHHD